MEPRNEVLRKTPEHRREGRKRRFQIVKLEERIAPNQGGIPNGGRDWGYYKPCHGAHGKCFP
jgi:hypothetical protein